MNGPIGDAQRVLSDAMKCRILRKVADLQGPFGVTVARLHLKTIRRYLNTTSHGMVCYSRDSILQHYLMFYDCRILRHELIWLQNNKYRAWIDCEISATNPFHTGLWVTSRITEDGNSRARQKLQVGLARNSVTARYDNVRRLAYNIRYCYYSRSFPIIQPG